MPTEVTAHEAKEWEERWSKTIPETVLKQQEEKRLRKDVLSIQHYDQLNVAKEGKDQEKAGKRTDPGGEWDLESLQQETSMHSSC